MHPILTHRARLLSYLLLWVMFGALLAGVITISGEASLRWAEAFAVPLAVLMGLECLPCWYLIRGLAGESVSIWRLAGTGFGVGCILLSVWLGAATLWARALKLLNVAPNIDDSLLAPLLVFAGVLAS